MTGGTAAGNGIVAGWVVVTGLGACAALGLIWRGLLAAGGCGGLSWLGLLRLRACAAVKEGAVRLCNMVGE